jgi:hypothetical protein
MRASGMIGIMERYLAQLSHLGIVELFLSLLLSPLSLASLVTEVGILVDYFGILGSMPKITTQTLSNYTVESNRLSCEIPRPLGEPLFS